ncbi:carbohydrate ABC transporter permease [Butyrivibrio sp. MC2013]|uniref:carbohydrate ABC transporter permease n=1 Tax=Butyrivibrio sp. MC2013 TaxID=1280686 RepID=UPI00040054C6|nr:sugar ABC transporter permease [Butyrivibrio sp. MC2013]
MDISLEKKHSDRADAKAGKKPFWKTETFQGYTFMIPTLIGFPLFCVYPLIYSLYCSFCDWDGYNPPAWAGIKNYKYILTLDPIFKKSLLVTFEYALINVPIMLILGLALAVLLNKKLPGIKIFRVIYYLPTIVPAVAALILWQFIFKSDTGLLNGALRQIGLPTVGWLTDENAVLVALSIIKWWTVGGMMMIFLSGLQSVPAELYEACELDGAGGWAKFRHITIPMITPILFMQLITGLIGGLQAFTEASVITGGGPSYASHFVNFDIYRTAFGDAKYGRACAEAWILFIIIMVLTVVVFRKSETYVYYDNE